MSALNGMRVLITRPAQQAEQLCRLITEQGDIAIRFPTVAVVATDNIAIIQKRLQQLDAIDCLIFVSSNAVNFALKANNGKIIKPKTTRLVAIGKATAFALQQAGLIVDVIPDVPYNSEALLAMPEMQAVNEQRIVIVRGLDGRETLATELRNRGAEVEYLTVYQRLIPNIDNSELIALLKNKQLNIITATSGEIVQNLLQMVAKSHHQQLFDLPLIVVSDRIKQLAAELGFKHIAVSNPANEAILETIKISMITGE